MKTNEKEIIKLLLIFKNYIETERRELKQKIEWNTQAIKIQDAEIIKEQSKNIAAGLILHERERNELKERIDLANAKIYTLQDEIRCLKKRNLLQRIFNISNPPVK